ncbi:MAG TPA: hypothetical protein VMS65_13950 [Polyangiaceae bacterium]|nr:hypothetical protein [Polyangiaceae bacterium]
MRCLSGAAVFLLILALPRSAAAWVETQTKSLLSTVDVAADGRATVSHELVLDVRGGPLRELELKTSDRDAEPLPDATVTKMSTGQPFPLVVERSQDGALKLEIDHERGIRAGRYLFSVRYRTNLLAVERLRKRGGGVEASFIGPRLQDGVDGVRVIFRLPPASVPPRLPATAPNEPDPTFGVLLGEVRRTPEADEIELLRSHVASGEPVLWRVEASQRAFPALFNDAEVTATLAPVSTLRSEPSRRRSSPWALIAAATGVVFAAVVALKAHLFARACSLAGATPRGLVPVPAPLRALLSGFALGVSLYVGAELGETLAAGFALVAALAMASLGVPRRERRPRGPGRWLPIAEADAFRTLARSLPGAWLDSGTLRGLASLGLVLGVIVLAAGLELGRSPYHALLTLLCGAVVFPIFFTGRASDLVSDRVAFSRRFVRDLARRLRDRSALRAVPWARVPDDAREPDELRLLVQPRDAVGGLVALETGVEPERGMGGFVATPFVIVRTREGSQAQALLPRELVWTRGRRPDERVAILKPKLPTVALTVALVERLAEILTNQRPKSSRMSAGMSASTSKPSRVPSPAHAT